MHTPRQIELIEAAITLTSSEGIQKLTMRNIATHVGISEAAVYRHFDNKQDLLKAVLVYLDALLSPLLTDLVETQDPPQFALTNFLNQLFTLIEQNKAFTLMIFSEETFNVEPSLKGDLLALLEANLTLLTKFFSDVASKGHCRSDVSAHQLAIITFGAIRLSVSHWHLNGNDQALSDATQQLSQTFTTLFSLT